MHGKRFFILWPLFWCGECRVVVITSSQKILSQFKTKTFKGIFKFFTANSLIHIIASYLFHSLIKRSFFAFVLRSRYSFALAFDLWVTWQQQLLRCYSLLLPHVEAIISQHKGSQTQCRENAYTCRNARIKSNLIGCMWCVKRIILVGRCPAGIGV